MVGKTTKTNNFWKLEMISNKHENFRHKWAAVFLEGYDAQLPCDFEDSGVL